MKTFETNLITATGLSELLNLKYEKRFEIAKDHLSGRFEMDKPRYQALKLEINAYKCAEITLRYYTEAIKNKSYNDLLRKNMLDFVQSSPDIKKQFIDNIFKAEMMRGNDRHLSEVYSNCEFDLFHDTFLINTDFIYGETLLERRLEQRKNKKSLCKSRRERRKNYLEKRVKNMIRNEYENQLQEGILTDLPKDIYIQLIEESLLEMVPNLKYYFISS